jgi:hypothetical protein
MSASFFRVLKTAPQTVIRRRAAIWQCSHMKEYAALAKSPRALADGLMLVFALIVNNCVGR